jgi:hypothetical protein
VLSQVAELRKSKDILDKSVASLQAKVEQLSGKVSLANLPWFSVPQHYACLAGHKVKQG